jgi:hypothetical protein
MNALRLQAVNGKNLLQRVIDWIQEENNFVAD